MTQVCLTNVLQMFKKNAKANRNETYSFLLAARQLRSSGKWVKHTNIHFIKKLVINSGSLLLLPSHQQRTVPEFNWTELQTILFKQTRIRFTRSDDSVHIIQMNRTLTSIEPGCAPKVLVWKHPYTLPEQWLSTAIMSCKILHILRVAFTLTLLVRTWVRLTSEFGSFGWCERCHLTLGAHPRTVPKSA